MKSCVNRTFEEIKNLKRKSALQQYCHYQMSSRVRFSAKILNVSLILLSGLTMLSTTVHVETIFSGVIDETIQKRLAAGLSILVFLLMLLRLELRLSEIASAFKAGADGHTRFLRRIDMQISGLEEISTDDAVQLGTQLTEDYNAVVDAAREIPAHHFLRLKQGFLQQKEMSKRLDVDPFTSLKDIRNRLRMAETEAE